MGGTMRLGLYPARLAPGSQVAEGLRRRGRLRAPPPPLRGEPAVPHPARGRRPGVLGHVARRPPRRVHRAARPPVLGRHAGAPRVQEPARPPAPAVLRVRRRRPRPRPRAARLACSSSRSGACGATRGSPAAPLSRSSASGPSGRVMPSVAVGEFRSPDGEAFERDLVHHPGAVDVVPLVDDGRSSCWCASTGRRSTRLLLEIPAGKRDVDGEAPEITARRELAEEVGIAGRPPRAAGHVPQLAGASPTSTRGRILATRPDAVRRSIGRARGGAHDDRADRAGRRARADRRRARSPTPRRSSGCCSPTILARLRLT